MQKKVTPVSKELSAEVKKLDTMSAKIRYLASKGHPRADISRILTTIEGREIRYQWIKNVLDKPLKSK